MLLQTKSAALPD